MDAEKGFFAGPARIALAAAAVAGAACVADFMDPARSARRLSSRPLIAAAADVASIEMESGEGKLVLRAEGGSWRTEPEGYPVDSGKPAELLALAAAETPRPRRGRTAAAHAALGLEEGAASSLVLRDGSGRVLANLLTGKEDATGRFAFARRAGEDEAFSVDARIAALVDSPARRWYDLSVWRAVRGSGMRARDIQALKIAFADGTGYALERGAGGSWASASGDVDAAAAEAFAGDVAAATARDFLPAERAAGGGAVDAEASLVLGDGTRASYRILKAEGALPVLEVAGARFAFELDDWTAARLARSPASLRKASGR